jgi:hypothetical protein
MNHLVACAGVPLFETGAATARRFDFHTGNRFEGQHLSRR